MGPDKSPRNVVTAANRFFCDYSPSTHAFPTAVFAGGQCGNGSHAAATTRYLAETKSKKARGKASSGCLPNRRDPLMLPFKLDSSDARQTIRLLPRSRNIGSKPLRSPQHNTTKERAPNTNNNTMRAPCQQGASAGRSKSSAIAIHKTPDADWPSDHDRSSSSLKILYDYSTWQMYARITDHRRRFPLGKLYTYEIPQSQLMTNPSFSEGAPMDAMVDKTFEAAPDHQEQFYDGEIFDLEL